MNTRPPTSRDAQQSKLDAKAILLLVGIGGASAIATIVVGLVLVFALRSYLSSASPELAHLAVSSSAGSTPAKAPRVDSKSSKDSNRKESTNGAAKPAPAIPIDPPSKPLLARPFPPED